MRILGLALLLISTAVIAAPAEWLIIENPYFRAYASTSESRARELLTELDEFRVAVQIITNLKIPKDARRTEVLILGADFDELTGSRGAGGLALSTAKDEQGRIGTLIVMPADRAHSDEHEAIRHEYVHVLNRFRQLRYPIWYEEGTAEVFAQTSVEGSKTIVIGVPKERIRNFERGASVGIGTWQSFDTIVSASKSGRVGFTDTYLQYWLLTHYLLFGNPSLAPDLEQCLLFSDGGMDPLVAFTKAFGQSPNDLWNGDLSRYRRKFKAMRYTLAKPIAGEPFVVRADSNGESAAALAALQAKLSAPPESP